MTWKNEVIATAKDAVSFLETHVPRLLPGSTVECELTPFLSCEVKDDTGGIYLMSFDAEYAQKRLELLNLKLCVPADKRYAVTDLAMKALLGVASERQDTNISLYHARSNEARILPAYGAFPRDMTSKMHVDKMGRTILLALNSFKQHITPSDRANLEEIAKTFSSNKDKAWFDLAAQRVTIPEQGLFSEIIFRDACKQGNLCINFSHTPTMTFLEGRLGALPPLAVSERRPFKRRRSPEM